MLNIIIFGGPGSGKGTQSKYIKEKYNLLHLSTGDLLRAEIAADSELGREASAYISKGHLVPDEMIIRILEKTITERLQTEQGAGIILDGFPRTVAQAEALDEMTKKMGEEINILIDLEVPEEDLIERLLKRKEIEGRADDNLETIKSRLNVYNEQTAPVKEYYKKKKVHTPIKGTGSIDEIFERISKSIDASL